MFTRRVIVAFGLALSLYGCGAVSANSSSVKGDAAGGAMLPPQPTFTCSEDGSQTSGIGVFVDQSPLDGAFSVQLGTWSGDGVNYTAISPSQAATSSIVDGYLALKRPGLELYIAQTPTMSGSYQAQLYGQKTQQALLCTQLRPVTSKQ